jgi:hypothetical protein
MLPVLAWPVRRQSVEGTDEPRTALLFRRKRRTGVNAAISRTLQVQSPTNNKFAEQKGLRGARSGSVVANDRIL